MISIIDITDMADEPPRRKVGDICTVQHSRYILEQGRIENVYENGSVLLEGSDHPAWPVGAI